MIGAINQIGTQFRYIGGRVALCDVSPQMLDMLEIMHLKDLWMIFDTRKIALRDEQGLMAPATWQWPRRSSSFDPRYS